MKKVILTIIATLALTSAAYAGSYNIGISGSLAFVQGSGSETTTAGAVAGGAANTNNKDVHEIAPIGSIFVEFETDGGIALGFEHTPGEADVSSKTHERAETAQGVSGVDASGSITRTANASIDIFNTVYVEVPLGALYVKAGWSQVDVTTNEKAITDSGTYGNATLDGYTVGIGSKGSFGDFFTKLSIERTDFDELGLTSTTSNKITADLDVTELKFAIGKAF